MIVIVPNAALASEMWHTMKGTSSVLGRLPHKLDRGKQGSVEKQTRSKKKTDSAEKEVKADSGAHEQFEYYAPSGEPIRRRYVIR